MNQSSQIKLDDFPNTEKTLPAFTKSTFKMHVSINEELDHKMHLGNKIVNLALNCTERNEKNHQISVLMFQIN